MEAENAMRHSALYSVGKARSRRLKWHGSTDKKCLGNDQSDKQGQKSTQCLPREGQGQGFVVKGTGEYGLRGMCSDSVVCLHDAERLYINKMCTWSAYCYVPTKDY